MVLVDFTVRLLWLLGYNSASGLLNYGFVKY